MSIFDTFDTNDNRITREYLERDGWVPTSNSKRTWEKRNQATTHKRGLIPSASFKYTFRDPHRKIKYVLQCNGPFWVKPKIYNDIKNIHDLNTHITAYINTINYITTFNG